MALVRFVLAVLAALSLVSCGTPKTSSDKPTPKADPTINQPDTGTCWQMDNITIAMYAPEAVPVDCSQPHNVMTLAVLKVGDSVDLSTGTANPEFDAQSAQCTQALNKELSMSADLGPADVHKTAFLTLPFLPDSASIVAGARWAWCGVYVRNSSNPDGLEPLPAKFPLLEKGAIPRRFASCVDKAYKIVSCSAPHKARHITTVTFDKRPYPGRSWFVRRAEGCRIMTPVNRRYVALWSSKWEWKVGERYVSCFHN